MTAPSEDQINDKRAQNAFWINKENCQKIIFELLSKKNYFAFKVDKTDHLSLTFLSRYALPFLKSFISCLLKTKTEYVPSKIQERSLEYIIKSFKFMRKEPVDLLLPWERSQNNQNSQVSRSYEPIPDFKQLILNHSELLMFDVLLPSLSYTSEDNHLWVSSPIDFIKNEENYLNGSPSPIYRTDKNYLSRVKYCFRW